MVTQPGTDPTAVTRKSLVLVPSPHQKIDFIIMLSLALAQGGCEKETSLILWS